MDEISEEIKSRGTLPPPLSLSHTHTSGETTSETATEVGPKWDMTEGEREIEGFQFTVYKGEEDLQAIMELVGKDLSEPYSVYTYRYFLNGWPQLCMRVVTPSGDLAGCCVSKLDYHHSTTYPTQRGYVAMLAVKEEYRGKGLGSQMVIRTINAMRKENADEVSLEAEVTNKTALYLYENLGFIRDKLLMRYYLNGVDAYRLKLWLK